VQQQSYNKYGSVDLTSGVCGSLDAIDHLNTDGHGTNLSTGDSCDVVTEVAHYVYRYDADSVAAHFPPDIISPLSAPVRGRWVMITAAATGYTGFLFDCFGIAIANVVTGLIDSLVVNDDIVVIESYHLLTEAGDDLSTEDGLTMRIE